MILRVKSNDKFKEFHVKVFNTGKLEIPGIQTEESFNIILDMIIDVSTTSHRNNIRICS